VEEKQQLVLQVRNNRHAHACRTAGNIHMQRCFGHHKSKVCHTCSLPPRQQVHHSTIDTPTLCTVCGLKHCTRQNQSSVGIQHHQAPHHTPVITTSIKHPPITTCAVLCAAGGGGYSGQFPRGRCIC
jgi:hypothetical protein